MEQPEFEVLVKDSTGVLKDVVNPLVYKAKLPANSTSNIVLNIDPFIGGEKFSTEIRLTEIKED